MAKDAGLADDNFKKWLTTVESSGTVYKTSEEALQGYQSYLKSTSTSLTLADLKTKALSASMKVLSTLGWMALAWGISQVVSGLSQLAHVSDNVAKKAQEVGDSFSNTKKDLEDYKAQVEDLQKIIHDSSSSISEVSDARKNLMSIQDELIDKYGTEEGAINSITSAINGEAEAWERLTEIQWQTAKNEFNDNGFWDDLGNSIDGYKDNIDRMLDGYGNYSQEINVGSITGHEKREEAEKLLSQFGKINKNSGIASITLTGNASEVHEQLLNIQNVVDEMDFDFGRSFESELTKMANSAKEVSEQYTNMYNQYILNEEVLKNGEYRDSFKDITEQYQKLQNAISSNDTEKVNTETDDFAQTVIDSMNQALANGDKDVADYFRAMYPELQGVIDQWRFDVDFTANTGELEANVSNALSKLSGHTTETLAGFNYKTATDDEIEGYNELCRLADLYNMEIDEFIKLLEKRNLVASESYNQLAEKFGKDNVITLSDEDLQIAYEVSDATIQSWDELTAAIEEFKAAAEDAGDSLSASLLSEDTLKTLSEYKSNLSTLQGLLSDIAKGSFDPSKEVEALNLIAGMMPEFNLELYRAADGTINFASALDDLAGQSMQALIAKCPEAAMQARNLYNQMAGSEHAVKGAVSAYYDIVSVLERVRAGESLTAQEIARLIAKHSELSTQLVITAEGFSIEEDALVSLARQMAGSANDSISTQIALTKAIMEACYLRVKAYGIEAQAFDKMANRYASAATPAEKKAQEQMIANATEGMGKDAAPAIIGAVREYSKAAGEMLAFEKQLEEMSGNVASRLGGFSTSSPGGSASKSAASEFKGQIDWVSESIASLTDEIGRLDSSLKNAEQYSARLGWSDKLIKKNKQLAATYKQASAAYKEEFSKSASGLPKKYVSAIKGGNTFKVEDFSGKGGEKTYNKIQEVITAWRNYQKALADEQGAWEAVADAVMDKASLVQEAYGDRLDNIAKRKGILENEVAALEAKGLGVSAKYYKELIALEEERRKKLAKEKSELEQGFSDAVASGAIKKYSNEWFQYVGIIQGINLEIQNSGNSITELSNAIRSLKWDSFDTLLGKFTAITDEVNFLLGHMGDFDMVDSDGNYTKEGLATLGLHSQGYQIHSSNAAKYKEEADSLAGAKDSESIARREELLGLYRDSITAAQEERRAMVGLAQEGIQAQIDSMGELISKKKEALQAEKELEDYRESIAEKQKSVTDIEKAMAALSGDDSEEAKSKLRKLRSDLKDAQKDLSGTEKDYAYNEKEKGLDELLTNYTSNMEALMGDTGKLFTDTMALVGENASVVGQTLGQVAQGLGYEITSSVSSAWEAAGASASGYATTMDTVSARIHATLGSITAQWEKVTKAADKAAAAQLGALGSKGNYTSGVSDPIASGTASNGAAAMASGAASGASAATSAVKAQVEALLKDKSNHSKNAVSKGDGAYQKLSGVNKAIVDAGYTNLSYSGAAKLAALLGLGNVKGADMVGNDDLKKKMLDKLMGLGLQGFSTGGVIKTYTGEDGLLLAQKGESVMSKEATALLRELSIAAPAFMRPTTPQFEQTLSQGGQNVTVSEGAFHFDMPNVVDAQGMVRELQNDRRLQKAVKQVVFGEGLGDGRLGVNRI